jgi:hypothetical protein
MRKMAGKKEAIPAISIFANANPNWADPPAQ